MNIVQPCFLVWILFLPKSPSFNQATHVPHASWAMPALLQPFTSSLIWITYSTSLEFVEGVHLRWWNQQIYRIFNDLQPCQKRLRYGRYGARACSQRFSAKDSSTALNSSKGSPQWGTGCAWQSASTWNADSTCLNSTGGSFNTPLLHFIIRNSCRILQIWSLAFDIFELAKIYGIK